MFLSGKVRLIILKQNCVGCSGVTTKAMMMSMNDFILALGEKVKIYKLFDFTTYTSLFLITKLPCA
jgi:hypothetical protein